MISFTRDELLYIRQNTPQNILTDFDYSDVLLEIVVGGVAVLFRCYRMCRWGKRASALVKLRQRGLWTPLLEVNYRGYSKWSSSAFNTIIPDTLQNKLTQLSIPTSICQWINSFLTDRQQLVRLWKLSSSTHSISTGAPQGCVLSPPSLTNQGSDVDIQLRLCYSQSLNPCKLQKLIPNHQFSFCWIYLLLTH